MQISELLPILRRWWPTLIVAAAVSGLCGYVVGGRAPARYEASTRLIVGPINTDAQTLKAAGQLGQTYAELATSDPVVSSVAAKLSLGARGERLSREVSASANEVTRLLTIRVSDRDPKLAAQIADGLGQELQVMSGRDGQHPEGALEVVQPAAVPSSPASSSTLLIVILAVLAGLVAAGGAVLLVEYLTDGVRGLYDLEQLEGVRALGVLASDSRGLPVVMRAPDSADAIAYRLLTTKVALAGDGARGRSFLVLGVEPGGEPAAVGLNMAASTAGLGIPTTVLDADGGAPEVTKRLNLSGSGVADLLRSASRTAEPKSNGFVRKVAPLLKAVPAGSTPPPVETQLESAAAAIGALHAEAELVVVVAAPLDRAVSTVAWAKAVDVAIVVAAKGTRRSLVQDAVDALRLIGVPVAGVVLVEHQRRVALRTRPNGAPSPIPVEVPVRTTSWGPATDVVGAVASASSNDDYWRSRPGAG